ncbi:MAG: hypothetical protein ABW049_13280 [Spongiibacteraceae bacterium]
MITYAYWFGVVALAIAALWLLGGMQKLWKAAFAVAAVILIVGWGAYYFHYQQIFVKNWGGIMHINTKTGYSHLGVTWKDDHLWVETYNPADNTCHFNEYSRGDLLQGEVIIRNCNPIPPTAIPAQ